jgi:hypothetical protein
VIRILRTLISPPLPFPFDPHSPCNSPDFRLSSLNFDVRTSSAPTITFLLLKRGKANILSRHCTLQNFMELKFITKPCVSVMCEGHGRNLRRKRRKNSFGCDGVESEMGV